LSLLELFDMRDSKSCDPATLMCTFVPAGSTEEETDEPGPFDMLSFSYACNKETKEPFCDVPPSFALSPSTWFVKERRRGRGVYGLEVAFAPGMYPEPGPFIFPPMLKEPDDGQAVDPNEKHGWSTGKRSDMALVASRSVAH
jgi:hypothetical protein